MRIVVFSNLYPPVFIGGYELGAARVVDELRRQGHEVLVFSSHWHYFNRRPGLIHRRHSDEDRRDILDTGGAFFGSLVSLFRQSPVTFVRRLAECRSARRHYLVELRRFGADRILAFNPFGVFNPVLADLSKLCRQQKIPLSAYVSDHWVEEWPVADPSWVAQDRLAQHPRWMLRVFARALKWAMPRMGYPDGVLPPIDEFICCSRFISDESAPHVPASSSLRVVPWGLPGVEQLGPTSSDHFENSEPLTILYAGQILEHKGLMSLVEALALCRSPHRLAVLGDETSTHADECRRRAGELGVLEQVQFMGRKSVESFPTLLRETGHALVVPSLWEEPFSILVLEGMAAGLPVVASRTGGTPEAITPEKTGLLFEAGNSREIASKLDRLEADRQLCHRLGENARRVVLERYTLGHMVASLLEGPVAEGQSRAA